jgi:hypothetical protein
MGTLKPGASYVYESPDGGESIYAREFGTTERKLIGESAKVKTSQENFEEMLLWVDIRKMACEHEGLRDELDRVLTLYYLIKDEKNNEVKWHPV